MRADYFQFAADNLRLQYPVISPPVKASEKARVCCAERAIVVESDSVRSLWRCPECGRLFAVPHR